MIRKKIKSVGTKIAVTVKNTVANVLIVIPTIELNNFPIYFMLQQKYILTNPNSFIPKP